MKNIICIFMSSRIKKIVVKKDLCIGAASCLGVAPEAFELDENNIAVVKATWPTLKDEILIESAQSCPTKAIFLYDSQGKQIFP